MSAWDLLRITWVAVCLSSPWWSAPSTPEEPVEQQAIALPTTALANNGKIRIDAIEGVAQTRNASDQTWQRAQVGQTLDEGSAIRVGPRSGIQVVLPSGQTAVLDRLGTTEVIRVDGVLKFDTKLGMKYGRTRYDIERGASTTQPNSTLGIRGSRISVAR